MKTYLSIDLDYFNRTVEHKNGIDTMVPFLRKVLALKVPTILVVNHDSLVPHINEFAWDCLINVDFHSDISDLKDVEDEVWSVSGTNPHKQLCNEGVWVNFVEGRKSGQFEWRYPSAVAYRSLGRCDEYVRRNFFKKSGVEYHNWEHPVRAVKGLQDIPWGCVVGVGCCISPGWVDENLFDLFFSELYPVVLRSGHIKIESLVWKMHKVIEKEGGSFNQYLWCADSL